MGGRGGGKILRAPQGGGKQGGGKGEAYPLSTPSYLKTGDDSYGFKYPPPPHTHTHTRTLTLSGLRPAVTALENV